MRILMLLSAAALSAGLIVTPAPAQNWGGSGHHGSFRNGDRHDRDGRDRRDHHRRDGRGGIFIEYEPGAWAHYNNRGWDSDSFNDWWHDRPDRAYPRWVQDQRRSASCDQDRMWWSGSGWHC